jgi:predicted alpha/beta superfamily hydrolase
MKLKIILAVLIGVILCLVRHPAYCQSDDTIPVTRQQQILLNSTSLHQQRMIWIHTPSGYDQSDDIYPVLYILDGDIHFKFITELTEFLSGDEKNRIPKILVIAILSDNRVCDFTPLADSGLVSSGGGAYFLQFIQDELVPYISSHYRAAPYRILAAHSLGGLFALYTKESAPKLFQSEILMSPAFYGPNKKVLVDFPSFLKRADNVSGSMFITIGDEPGAKRRIDTLAGFLKQYAPSALRWSYRSYPEDDHFSLPYTSMYDGLKFIYADFYTNIWDDQHLPTRESITEHFIRLSKKFGYQMKPGEEFVNTCGYKQLRVKQYDEAIALFKLNIENHPRSWNAYDSMGEAYMDAGNNKLAIENYEKSITINPSNKNGKEMLKKIKVH